ncbi:cell wall protein [Colletotrichum orchidophilum]|uniref:Cell wall protein n=1 Tax=Colletotrichum orchidophilum TaxID=1209926 RepID=A0A1G4BKX9_9PEZI|nr:cell wall protein [Colletotrichum orchidophilum]OHF01958.1 cell wall protein [Colletotrichum orchidophilum]
MKFTTEITLLTLAMGVFAQSATRVLTERDLTAIQGVIKEVGNSLKDLNKAVDGFNGDINGLTSAVSGFNKTLVSGTDTVKNTGDITLNDALQLQGSVTGLQDDGKALTGNLKKKKPDFEKANLCGAVASQIGVVGDGAKGLIDAVVKKVPASVQSVASSLAGGFAATLTSTQQEFAPGNCTNANGKSGGVMSGGNMDGGMSGGNGSSNGAPRTSSPAKASAATVSVGLGSIAVAAFAVMLL